MIHSYRDAWLRGTTCAAKYRDPREVMFENDTHIVLKHRSHAEYTGRFSGTQTCESFAKLYEKKVLKDHLNRTGGMFAPYIKEWKGRIYPQRVKAECKDLGVEFT
jgi:hypothetical protein